MKPKNKTHRSVIEAQKRLKPVSDEAVQWAISKMPCYYLQQRKSYWCLECGNKLEPSELGSVYKAIAGIDCPNCAKNLTAVGEYKAGATRATYWAVIDTAGKYQVVRMMITYKHMKKDRSVKFFTDEVMQHFIDEEGSVQTLSKLCNAFSHGYTDSWIHTSDIEVRAVSGAHMFRAQISPNFIYPKMSVLKLFRRNGFKSSTHGVNPAKFFRLLARISRFETLLKAKQYDLLRFYAESRTRSDIEEWPQIRICIRHGYKVKNASDWVDYISLLKHFGRDINNPHYICPDNLKAEHDRYVQKRRKQQEAEESAKQRALFAVEDPEYKKLKSRFFDIQINVDDLVIEPLKSVTEFIQAGDELKHCLFANNYHKRAESLILAAKRDGKYIETIEFSLENLKVIQSRGLRNKATEYNKIIVQTVNRNIHEIARRIS